MAHYEKRQNVHHWFPKVNHLVNGNDDYEDSSDSMLVDEHHDPPYIGDFPPKDDYSDHRFY